MSTERVRKSLEERGRMTDIERLRHSCAHVMATAILKLWPDAQLAAGPPVENGFYYDIDLDHRISPEDFPRIEEEMRRVVKENQVFEREVVDRPGALELAQRGRLGALQDREAPSRFKIDLLAAIPEDEEISLYRNGDFVDLCAGPHVARTGNCRAFRLMSVASAFYKGDSANPQLQRVYGTAFPTKAELDAHLEQLEEAKRRDHRKAGRELDLFHIDESVGQGLILWMPKGAVIRQQLQDYISEELRGQGYNQVFTPHIGKLELYRTSGHFPYYSDSQFPPIVERETLRLLADEGCSCADLGNRLADGTVEGFLLKPMNCPHHIRIFAARRHSYRDLPIRLAEFGTVYRWEQSGELGGLSRVRGFTQDDAHIFCTEDQLPAEILGCLDLTRVILSTLGLDEYRVRVSLRDGGPDKYVGDPANWDRAEEALRDAVTRLGVPYTEEPGEAAFYGPKIDFVVRDVIGREWQLGTVQVDYNLPERFDLTYTGADNRAHRPVMIHRAPFGSLERFVGVLIEHFSGNFPLWLAPEQVRVLPISDPFNDYAESVAAGLRRARLRTGQDCSSEKIGAKIRLAQLAKVPYMVILGAKEQDSKLLSLRHRKRGDLGAVSLDGLVEQLSEEVRNRAL
ncbi:MAG TPA: threonine--tRNA ligase [Verrucomicrobiales bacterium]|nr:threonine--tRNA ligase [Verrucomicrobiales bacterium]